MAKVTWTYIIDASDPAKNIRVATDAAGFDHHANRAAIARYFDIPEGSISAELDGRFYGSPGHSVIAFVSRVDKDIDYIESAPQIAAGAI